eukprot:NODE_24039_length_641_cov_1.503891.p1 GENE.NODE_24039_length_641_cov_1.503891~~NODE_24039_length_641_cov_1.503891.p1  ORF type:complete len:62 (+),score=13.37 NODE_24039_length_641_cov_1.503891:390-575(+)
MGLASVTVPLVDSVEFCSDQGMVQVDAKVGSGSFTALLFFVQDEVALITPLTGSDDPRQHH